MNRSEVVDAIEKIAREVFASKDGIIFIGHNNEVYNIYVVDEDRGPFLEASIEERVVAHAAINRKGSFTGSALNPRVWLTLSAAHR